MSSIDGMPAIGNCPTVKVNDMIENQMEEYNVNPGIIRIGTSGANFPGNKETFPEEHKSSSRLMYYSTLFKTTEINSTFYKIPLARTFERWSNEVADDFRFTIKLFREITHCKKLEFDEKVVSKFMQAAHHLSEKKGVLLIQFPASINFGYFNDVKSILERVTEFNQEKPFRLAIELRHKSWFNDTTYEFLENSGIILVFHDIPKSKPSLENVFTDTIYLRFHGPQGDYRGRYSEEFLMDYADRIKEWTLEGKDVYAYFNNTMGEAFENAQSLKGYCGFNKIGFINDI